jgi:hypothetical protein
MGFNVGKAECFSLGYEFRYVIESALRPHGGKGDWEQLTSPSSFTF